MFLSVVLSSWRLRFYWFFLFLYIYLFVGLFFCSVSALTDAQREAHISLPRVR